jgi:CysZ protein
MSHFAQAIALIATFIMVSLIPLALGSFILGLILGTGLRRLVRGRHLLWALPIIQASLFLMLGQRFDLVLGFQRPLPGWMQALGAATVGMSALLAAGIVAAFGRALASSAKLVSVEPGSGALPPEVLSFAPASRSLFGGLREGLAAPVDGFVFMARHPRLWSYAVVPVLLNILITAFILLLLIAAGAAFAVKLHPHFPSVWWGLALEILTAAAFLAVVGALAVGTGVVLNGMLCGHSHVKLARQVELLLGMRADQIHEVPFRHQAADSLRDVGWLLIVNLGLLALNIMPGAGTVAAVLLGGYFNGMTFGMDYLELPMSLRGLLREEQRAFAKRHRWHTIGLGLGVFVLNLVPVVGSILLATASAGAVLLYRRLEPAATAPLTRASSALQAVAP